MPTFTLVGDILHPGRVTVEAESLEEALDKATDGDFVVFDEQSDALAFEWNGDTETVTADD